MNTGVFWPTHTPQSFWPFDKNQRGVIAKEVVKVKRKKFICVPEPVPINMDHSRPRLFP